MDIYVYVVILCVSGLWTFQTVNAETGDVVNILHDIRIELSHLKLANERNERKIMHLESQVGECHTKYTELTKQTSSVASVEKRIADIELKVETNHQDLLKRLEKVEKGRAIEMKNDTSYISEIAEEVNDDAVEGENGTELPEAKERRIIPVTSSPTSNTRVAFTVYSSPTVVQNTLSGNIPFSGVETNEGHAFDPATHVFTCPLSGIYYFTSYVTSSVLGGTVSKRSAAPPPSPQVFLTEIVKDGNILVKTHFNIQMNSAAFANPSANSVVTVCNKGEAVWVQFRIVNLSQFYLDFGGKLTTFTGFLLWEL